MEILLNDDCSEKVAYDFADFPVFIHRELLSEYPNRTAPSHWHTDLEFLLIYSGRLQYNVNGFVRTLHAGEGIFVNAQQLHFGFSDRDEECEFLCVLVHPTLLCITPAIQQRFVLPVLQNEALPCLYLTPGVPWQGELLSHLRQIDAIQAAGGPDRLLRLEAEFFALWGLLFEHCPAGQPAAAHGADLDSIRRMVGFVQQCYPQKLLLRQIAAAGAVGESKCCQLFRRYFSQTPVEYLNRYRLDKSLALLRETDRSITEIALAVGFGGASYYAELFRRQMGQSPTEYRAKARNGG